MINRYISVKAIKQLSFGLLAAFMLLSAAVSLHASEVSRPFRGLTINANLELAQGKSYQDGIVLIVHGMLSHNRMEIIESAQRALLDNGQSSLAINLSLGIDNRRGFFDCNWPHRHQQEDTLDEISAWVEWLRDRGTSRIILLAHSRGANEAMVYAVDNLDPEVIQLVLLAPGTVDDTKQAFEERYGDHFDQQLARAEELLAADQADRLMENADFFFCPRASVSAKTFNSYYGKNSRFRDFQGYLPRVKIPTLISTGTQDERFPDIETDVAPFVDGERIRLNVIEGADHFFRDFNIDEAMEAVIEFIDDARQ